MTWHVAVYEALVHWAIAGLALLAMATVALVAIRQPARRIRVIEIALAALVALPLVPLIPGYPRVALLPTVTPPAPVAEVALPPAITEVPVVERQAPPADPAPSNGDTTSVSPALEPPAPDQYVAPAIVAAARANPRAEPASWRLPGDFRLWIVIAYFAGVAAMIAWSLLGLAAIARLLRSAREASDACRATFRDLAGPASDRVSLVVSPRASQPCALWWRRPTIVLPIAVRPSVRIAQENRDASRPTWPTGTRRPAPLEPGRRAARRPTSVRRRLRPRRAGR